MMIDDPESMPERVVRVRMSHQCLGLNPWESENRSQLQIRKQEMRSWVPNYWVSRPLHATCSSLFIVDLVHASLERCRTAFTFSDVGDPSEHAATIKIEY